MSIATRTNPQLATDQRSTHDWLAHRGDARQRSGALRDHSAAKGRPHVFDDALVARIIQVHTDQLEDHWLFKEQLARWSQDE